MAVQVLRRSFTVDEYHRVAQAGVLREDDRVELLNGEILQMAPIWSRHAASVKFWPALEEVLLAKLKPVDVVRLYKTSTWNPAPPEEVEAFARKIDYAVIGVGA